MLYINYKVNNPKPTKHPWLSSALPWRNAVLVLKGADTKFHLLPWRDLLKCSAVFSSTLLCIIRFNTAARFRAEQNVVFLSFMGIAFALWVSFNMSIWYIAVTFWCFPDYTVMIACLVFVTISPPSRCCIVICQTDNAVQLVFVHCATRVVFISGHRGNMFQEWFGCRHRWAVWQN